MSYREPLKTLDAWFARGTAAAGPDIVPCVAGCHACCLGPFDISPADGRQVRIGLAKLDDAARAGVQARAAEHLREYRTLEPTWDGHEVDALDEDAFDALCDTLVHLPCPALGEHGQCLVYEDRPATCRMTGLGMCTPDGDVLENNCPIQLQFTEYAALDPTLFELEQFEIAADAFDAQAIALGFHRTTVAGAIRLTPARSAPVHQGPPAHS